MGLGKKKMRIVIFGIGEIYRQNRDKIPSEDEIVAFLDNNESLQGTMINGITVYSPNQIDQIVYDKIVIMVVMSTRVIEMKNQLLNLGCARADILHYLDYVGMEQIGKPEVFLASQRPMCDKSVLIITSELGYHGGSITAVYASLALKDRGYEVAIAAPSGNERFIEEFRQQGITFILYSNLEYAKYKELQWTDNFEEIIVNTYPMTLCALEIGRHRKISLWIHESNVTYEARTFWNDLIAEYIVKSDLNLYAVSNVAKENFINNITKCRISLLPYGIPDLYGDVTSIASHLTFAVIASIHPIKQQLLYVDAVGMLCKDYQRCNEFLIIGKVDEVDYANRVEEKVREFPNVKLKGELTRNEMESEYNKIDVVVISSSFETMSLVATEAMMYGKVCIVCDVAGMAEFINHGENGLIYKTNDVNSLAEQISFCIENKDRLADIGKNARETYLQYFSMDKFGDRLEKIFN